MTDEQEQEQSGPTIRDKRRIDPETYQVRETSPAAAPADPEPATVPAEGNDQVDQLEAALAERTADLQRLQAEYVNYKRRVDRDRDVARKSALEGLVKELLPVLDDLRSAREHGELTGAFKAVGDEVERVTAKHGLETFGTKGDAFDPHIHDALMHAHAEGITGPTCVEILQPGYRIGERVLRPARVAVAEPSEPAAPAEPEGSVAQDPTEETVVGEPTSGA